MKEESIAKIFCKLVAIPSPSGSEIEVARYIKESLDGIGVESHFDGSGAMNQSNSGNLIALIKGNMKTRVMFVAHMDTVEVGDRKVKPVIKRGNITSDGETILGADNKASVACLIAAAKGSIGLKKRPEIIFAFTSREENGLMGAKYIDIKDVDYVFVLDGSKRTGIFISGSLGYLPFQIKINGRAAHAAMNPDKGANAIQAAGIFISRLKLGKDVLGGTMNIGTINGGTKINVIPDSVMMEGEVRGFTRQDIDDRLEHMEKELMRACELAKCSYEIIIKRENFIPPFLAGHEEDIIAIAKKAAAGAGLEFGLEKLSATCEANVLKQKYPMVLGINRGGSGPHSKSESISYKDLGNIERLVMEIIKNAG